MRIKLIKITVQELFEGYTDDGESGVVGYNGNLDIRPRYQREFIYNDKQRDAVIDTLLKGFPLNTMYWSAQQNNKFEIIDGQQRTVSICQYLDGAFSTIDPFLNKRCYFHSQSKTKQEQIKNYSLSVYVCNGTDDERLSWFKTINIAGEALTNQELRNAVYAGSWTTDAKRYFSKRGCVAQEIGKPYLKGTAIRQEYLETAIRWIAMKASIEGYMSKHQHDSSANQLWEYFQSVIDWIKKTFTKKHPSMKGVDWGFLYSEHGDKNINQKKIEKKVSKLIMDDDVTNKSGIYPYVLTGDEHHLSIRAFSEGIKQQVYEKQKGVCNGCKGCFPIEKMDADHIDPWHSGGKTIIENCQMLCKSCNRRKAGK